MSATTSATARVLVVLVAHDGRAWLPRVLDALGTQTHPHLDVVAVDNASEDGSRELLLERLGVERVLVADRDIGFGAAVAMALDADPSPDAPYVLLLHDDCALDPRAVEVMVEALERAPRVAAVGPKLRNWDEPGVLQSVGWTVDVTGRADSGVDAGELDQGQRDQERRCLYVSTTAMLVRREVFDSLGRLDRRYHIFRDDLDLCWRMWLAGHEVEVVPDAVGEHVAGATNYLRLGQTRFIGPRYFAERNTLATLMKNYGRLRLIGIVPLYFLVGIAKVVGFVLTRRMSDAWQTVRAWVWNVLHLRETLRLRAEVQQLRRRDDAELTELFGRVTPRARAYVEAMAEWVAGGDLADDRDEVEGREDEVPHERPEPEPAVRRLIGLARRRPVLVVGTLLAAVILAGTWSLLLPGSLRGGELAPWPSSPTAFLHDYVSGWHEAATFGTSETPSPSQALLGLLHLVAFGSEYLAPRLLLVGSLAVGWLLSLKAVQAVSARRLPRVAAATAYVLSPPVLAALVTGAVSVLVVVAVLPGIVAAMTSLARPSTPPKRAWRAVAGVILMTAIGGAFVPLLLPAVLVAGALIGFLGGLVTVQPAWRRALLSRTGVASLGPLVLLLPWSWSLLAEDGLLAGEAVQAVGGELWRWLLLAPDLAGMPGLLAGVGFVLAGALGLILGFPRRPLLVSGLLAAAVTGAVGAWWLDRTEAATWAGVPLLLTAGAFAGLLAVAFASAEAQLVEHEFGWRQIAVLGTAAAVAVSLVTVAGALVREPWDAYARDAATLPSFIVSEAQESGPFRIVLLAAAGGEVVWEVVDGTGPTMASYGLPTSGAAHGLVSDAMDDLLARRDPTAADRLAGLNVRYLIVPALGVDESLDTALLAQDGAEPRPVAEGRLMELVSWVPMASVVPPDDGATIAALEPLPEEVEVGRLRQARRGHYLGELDEPASVTVAEVPDGHWQATVDGEVFEPAPGATVHFEELPPGVVEVTHDGQTPRTVAVVLQLLALLFAVSLVLRPPGFARSFPEVEDPLPPAPASDRRDVEVGA